MAVIKSLCLSSKLKLILLSYVSETETDGESDQSAAKASGTQSSRRIRHRRRQMDEFAVYDPKTTFPLPSVFFVAKRCIPFPQEEAPVKTKAAPIADLKVQGSS